MNGMSERTEANASQNAATDGRKFTGVGEQLGARDHKKRAPKEADDAGAKALRPFPPGRKGSA